MSGFSPQWLDLREPVDHRSRNKGLGRALAKHFEGWRPMTVVDIGCGTGSNLRATAPLLGPDQHWTLVDYDQALLDAAVERLSAWADGADRQDGKLALFKGAKRINVEFRRADLAGDLEGALGPGANLVTASAFFDLVSADFISALVTAVARRKAAFFTVLTYDGDQRWTPEHDADAAMADAFHAHQATDKGFGAAAGPNAPDLLGEALAAAGYTVTEADSAWRLGEGDGALIADLARGFAEAVRETGKVEASVIADWVAVLRTGAVVGHTDTLALPPA
ncbi:MAG: class I SAM-dependent methyltransferase [Hyphomicrobiaceae bacterium]|nr:MAG: class I SAM-dependent methyltransferase [Hyphomicrobiaceae bacterium]